MTEPMEKTGLCKGEKLGKGREVYGLKKFRIAGRARRAKRSHRDWVILGASICFMVCSWAPPWLVN